MRWESGSASMACAVLNEQTVVTRLFVWRERVQVEWRRATIREQRADSSFAIDDFASSATLARAIGLRTIRTQLISIEAVWLHPDHRRDSSRQRSARRRRSPGTKSVHGDDTSWTLPNCWESRTDPNNL